jgi:hypothetical protein
MTVPAMRDAMRILFHTDLCDLSGTVKFFPALRETSCARNFFVSLSRSKPRL